MRIKSLSQYTSATRSQYADESIFKLSKPLSWWSPMGFSADPSKSVGMVCSVGHKVFHQNPSTALWVARLKNTGVVWCSASSRFLT